MTSPNVKRDVFKYGSLERECKLKCVLVGDISVGKTSLAIRFSRNKFDETYRQTIGASFMSKVVRIHDEMITFQIWDTAGQERYKSLVPMYLRGAHIALVVYDVTDPDSFANIGMWLDALHHHGDLVKTILVGNKSDLTPVVDEMMVLEYAESHDLQFVKTSAKTGENVEQLFMTMGAKVVREMKRGTQTSHLVENPMIVIPGKDERDSSRKKCCKIS